MPHHHHHINPDRHGGAGSAVPEPFFPGGGVSRQSVGRSGGGGGELQKALRFLFSHTQISHGLCARISGQQQLPNAAARLAEQPHGCVGVCVCVCVSTLRASEAPARTKPKSCLRQTFPGSAVHRMGRGTAAGGESSSKRLRVLQERFGPLVKCHSIGPVFGLTTILLGSPQLREICLTKATPQVHGRGVKFAET